MKVFATPKILTISDNRPKQAVDADGNKLYLKQKVDADSKPLYLDAKGVETLFNTGVPVMVDTIEITGQPKMSPESYSRKAAVVAVDIVQKTTIIENGVKKYRIMIELFHADNKTATVNNKTVYLGGTSEMWPHVINYDETLTDTQILNTLSATYNLS